MVTREERRREKERRRQELKRKRKAFSQRIQRAKTSRLKKRNLVTVKRKSGITQIIDRGSGKIIKQTGARGQRQIPITISKSKTGINARRTTIKDINRAKREAFLRRLTPQQRTQLTGTARQAQLRTSREAESQRRRNIFATQGLSSRLNRARIAEAKRQERDKQLSKVKLPFKKQSFIPTVTEIKKTRTRGVISAKKNLDRAVEKKKQEIIKKSIRGKPTIKEKSALFGLALTANLVGQIKGVIELPSTIKYFKNHPSEIKKIPKNIQQSALRFGQIARTNPQQAMGIIAGELIFLKGATSAITKITKFKNVLLTRLDPRFKGNLTIGKVLNIGKGQKLTVVGKIPKETLKSQVKKAGKTVGAISSQADDLVNVLRRKKGIKKPIPKEKSFSATTKALIKKFDNKTITNKEISILNKRIKKEGAKGLLERSFFADPKLRIRPSRLGVLKQPKANLIDYLSGDITFKRSKPQILLFRKAIVERFPKTPIFKIIKAKLKSGRTLTSVEADALLKFQLKKSGKFKPVGFVSGESEILIPAGELIRRKKVVGVTTINGRRVPIVETELFKPTGKLKSLLDGWEKGSITSQEIKSLDRLLKAKTRFNYGLSISKAVRAKYVNIKQFTSFTSARSLKARTPKKLSKAISRKSSRKKLSKAVSRKSVRSPVSKKPAYSRTTISRIISRTSSGKSVISRSRLASSFSSFTRSRSLIVPPPVKKIIRLKKKLSNKDKDILKKYVIKNPKKYRPSLSALLLGITGYKIPKSISGFNLRPVIIKKRIKVSKKRRKKR